MNSISSWFGVSQVRQILSNCQNVDVAHRRFATNNHNRLTWSELKRACKTSNPNTALTTLIKLMKGDEMSGRLNLARDALIRSKYDHSKYGQFADYIMDEAKRCAVLTITCLSIRHINATTQELAVFHMENKQYLHEINEHLEQGFESLRNGFFDQQLPQDLREQLDSGFTRNEDIYEETTSMFNFLSNKYPFRGWAVIRSDSNNWPADRAIWGFGDRYKELLNEKREIQSNLIVHAAKRYQRNFTYCSSIRDLLSAKQLHQHLAPEQFERLQNQDLRLSVDVLKEWLINLVQAPDRLFALIVQYTPLNEIEYDPDYHYMEIIKKDGKKDKIVLIGWC